MLICQIGFYLQQFTQLGEPLQIAVLVSILLVITVSGFAIQRFDLAVLRFFEGYWHPRLNRPRYSDSCLALGHPVSDLGSLGLVGYSSWVTGSLVCLWLDAQVCYDLR